MSMLGTWRTRNGDKASVTVEHTGRLLGVVMAMDTPTEGTPADWRDHPPWRIATEWGPGGVNLDPDWTLEERI